MPAKKSDPWSKLLYNFSQETTFHGVRYVGETSFSIIRRLLWGAVVLGMFAVFTYIVVIRCIDYFKYQMAVNVELLSVNNLTFPAVTVCNENVLRATPVHQRGLYDTMVYKFNSVKSSGQTNLTSDGCVDKFYRYVGIGIHDMPSDDVITYADVTVDVCLEICTTVPKLGCNGFLYDRNRKSCDVIKEYFLKLEPKLVPSENHDYYRRTRCESAKDVRCSFDSGLCDFRQDTADGTDWTRSQETTPTPLTGPDADHTTGTGSFLFLQGDAERFGRLVSPEIIAPSSSPRCLEFYFYMSGEDVGSLNVLKRTSAGRQQRVWRLSGHQGSQWRRGFVRLGSGIFEVIFEGHTRENDRKQRNHIAIDDARIAECKVLETNCLSQFDGVGYTGNISVTQTGRACVDWEVVSRSNPLNYFLFPDDDVTSIGAACRNPGGQAERPWCFTDVTGSSWEHCDISLCECDEDEMTCRNGLCVPVASRCDGNNDCRDNTDEMDGCDLSVSCDFETDFQCGYRMEKTSSRFVWAGYTGDTPSPGTGPSVDRTLLTKYGRYMIAMSHDGRKGDVTRLISPEVTTSRPSCLTFYTFTFGNHIGKLYVYVTAGSERFRVFLVDSGPDRWVRQRLTLNHAIWRTTDQPKRIVFEAIRGDGISGDIALDDVIFTEGKCPVAECEDTEFSCINARCVDWNLACNGLDDCYDGSDEYDPCVAPACNFEGPARCGYRIESMDSSYVWERHDPDKAIGNSEGYFMLISAVNTEKSLVSTLFSPWVWIEGVTCFNFRFWLGTPTAGTIVVYTRNRLTDKPAIQQTLMGLHDNEWLPSWAEVVPEDGPTEVRLEFHSFTGMFGGDAGIDEIQVAEGYCDKSYYDISCTFETQFVCGYEPLFMGTEFSWVRARAGKLTYTPKTERTLRKRNTGYILATRSLVVDDIRMAYVLSPWQQVNVTSCLTIHVYMRYSGLFTVNMQYRDLYLRRLYTTAGYMSGSWFPVDLNVPPGELRLVLQATRGFERYSTISVDDIFLIDGPCNKTCAVGLFSCENRLCINGSAVCDGHDDCGDGSDEAQCESGCLTSRYGQFYTGTKNVTRTGTPCLPWTQVGLEFLTKTGTLLFPDATFGDTGNYCRNPDKKPEGPWCMTGPGGSWDFCDIPACECKENQFKCQSSDVCVGDSQTSDGHQDCPDDSDEQAFGTVSCDFESPGICGYQALILDQDAFQWLPMKGYAPSSSTGPNYDHTFMNSTGTYMYTEASGYYPGDVAWLRSPRVEITEPSCFSFYYMLYGRDIDTFSIYRLHYDGTLNLLDAHRFSKDQVWYKISYNVPTGHYGFLFEFTRGYFFRGDAAIDDTNLTAGACPDLPICSPDEYSCDNGRCISMALTCDGKNDCGDWSDETTPCDQRCLRHRTGNTYTGRLSVTSSGRKCDFWSHHFDYDDEALTTNHFRLSNESVDGAENFCRNPTGSGVTVWCYVTGGNGSWEYCDLPMCPGFSWCDKDEFECTSRKCVTRDVECDGKDDCGDGSDEVLPCDGKRLENDHAECKLDKLGKDYQGSLNTTAYGLPCKPWAEVSGNIPEEMRVNGSNLCRNVEPGFTGPYCYTENTNVLRQYCDVPICPGSLERRGPSCSFTTPYICGYSDESLGGQRWVRRGLIEGLGVGHFDSDPDLLKALEEDEDLCQYESTAGTDYQGTQHRTVNGILCQRWDSFVPVIHSYTANNLYPDPNRTAASNSCRNPGGSQSSPWCFTLDPNKKFETCGIPVCQTSVMMAPPIDNPSTTEPAVLTSPEVQVSESERDFCFRFVYMMTGSDLGTLTLFADYTDGVRMRLWQHFGDNGYVWDTAQVPLRNQTQNFRLTFVSNQGYSKRAIALATVEVLPALCADINDGGAGGTSCSEEQFTCRNTECIPSRKVCDQYFDCSDLSDETNCECEEFQFRCNDGQCIAASLVLDGTEHCLDGSDEQPVASQKLRSVSRVTSYETSDVIQDVGEVAYKVAPLNATYRLTSPELSPYDGEAFIQFLQNASHQQEDFIHECLWESRPCPEGYLHPQQTDYGLCYTFNAAPGREQMKAFNKGIRHGLQMVLNVEQYETTPVLRDVAGVKIYLHDKGQVAQVKNLGFALSPGMQFLVNVEATKLKNLGPPHGKCGSRKLKYYSTYSRANCEAECEVDETIRVCSCIAPHMPTTNLNTGHVTPFCSFNQYFDCYLKEFEYTRNDSRGDDKCECKPPCSQVIYNPVISFSALTEQTAAAILTTKSPKLARKFHEALETQDRVSEKWFLSYLNVSLDVLNGFDLDNSEWEQTFEKVELALNNFQDLYTRDMSSLHKIVQVLMDDYTDNIRGRLYILNNTLSNFVYTLRFAAYTELDDNLLDSIAAEARQVEHGITSFYHVRSQWLSQSGGGRPYRAFTKSDLAFEEECDQIRTNLLANISILQNISGDISLGFLPDVVQLAEQIRHCYGNYFTSMENTVAVFDECHPRKMQGTLDELDEHMEHYDFRALSSHILQDQFFVRGVILDYIEGTSTTLTLAEKLNSREMSEIISHFEYFFLTFETDLINEHGKTIHTLEDQYQLCYSKVLHQIGHFEHYFKRNQFVELENLDIWLRPLVSLSNSFIDTVETNSKAVVFAQFDGSLQGGESGDENSEFIQDYSDKFLSEHIMSYFHGITVELKQFMKRIRNSREHLVSSLGQLSEMLTKYRTKSELNEEYIRTNYLIVNIFYSSLTYENIEQLAALSEEDIMGNIGGYMGLLLGGSILSLLELLDLLVHNLCVKTKEKLTTERRSSSKQNGSNSAQKDSADQGVTNGAMNFDSDLSSPSPGVRKDVYLP